MTPAPNQPTQMGARGITRVHKPKQQEAHAPNTPHEYPTSCSAHGPHCSVFHATTLLLSHTSRPAHTQPHRVHHPYIGGVPRGARALLLATGQHPHARLGSAVPCQSTGFFPVAITKAQRTNGPPSVPRPQQRCHAPAPSCAGQQGHLRRGAGTGTKDRYSRQASSGSNPAEGGQRRRPGRPARPDWHDCRHQCAGAWAGCGTWEGAGGGREGLPMQGMWACAQRHKGYGAAAKGTAPPHLAVADIAGC